MSCADTYYDKRGIPADLLKTDRDEISSLSVMTQDLLNNPVNVVFLQDRVSTAIAVNTVLDTRTVSLVTGHGAIVGDTLELAHAGNGFFMQSQILAIAGNVITLDQPINFPYATTDIAVISIKDMNVDGSITRQLFTLKPLPNQGGHITKIIFEIVGDSAMDAATFGNINKLINGIVIRIKYANGNFKNLINCKDNGDIISSAANHSFLIPKGGNVSHVFSASLSFSDMGVAVSLDGATDEELQIIIQDNLTGLTRFRMTAQGHEV